MKAIVPSSRQTKVGQALSPANPNRTECWQAGYPLGRERFFDALWKRHEVEA